MSLVNCRVVLVRPEVAGNVGATARAMRNFGLTDLALVAPVANPLDEEARKRSTHGESILHHARIVETVDEAVADCVLVIGTSARTGGPFRRQTVGTPDEIMPLLAAAMASAPVALVFGPEPSGLSNPEVTRCHHLVTIPADPEYPALNLSQAVAICLYELHRAWLRGTEPASASQPIAPFAHQERAFAHLQAALTEIHFLYGQSADTLMHALRHLLGRAQPSPMEVDLLFGLARQMQWYASHHRPKHEDIP